MVTHRVLAVTLPLLPAEIGRAEARELARRELEKRIYHRDDPSLVERFLTWLFVQLGQRGADLVPGGWYGLILILLLLVLLIVAIRLRLGPMGRSHAVPSAALAGATLTPQQHRTAAEQAAASGQWAEAIRERLRAIARDLEERVVIDPTPGRTADELAAEAGTALPDYASELRAAARIFDDVWYGNRPATRESYERLLRLDEDLRKAKPVTAASELPGEPENPDAAVPTGNRP